MNRHPAEAELLLDYAAGALPEGPALAVAVHVSMNRRARAQVANLEAIGGALLRAMPGSEMPEGALDAVLDRLDDIEPVRALARARPAFLDGLPEPLLPYVSPEMRWTRSIPGLEEIALNLRSPFHSASLLRIAPGRSMPQHTHSGPEYTVVLSGSFSDETGVYGPGDLSIADAMVHQPTAGSDAPCVCLAVLAAPVTLTGALGRFLNPLIRMKARRQRLDA